MRIGPGHRSRRRSGARRVAAGRTPCDSDPVLDNLRKKFSKPIEAIEADRLKDRLADLGVTPIAAAPRRTPILVAGEIQGLQVVPRAGSPSLEVLLDDGTGRAVAVFTGRRRLGGVDCGRRILIEGVGRESGGRLLVMNPAYTIVE